MCFVVNTLSTTECQKECFVLVAACSIIFVRIQQQFSTIRQFLTSFTAITVPTLLSSFFRFLHRYLLFIVSGHYILLYAYVILLVFYTYLLHFWQSYSVAVSFT